MGKCLKSKLSNCIFRLYRGSTAATRLLQPIRKQRKRNGCFSKALALKNAAGFFLLPLLIFIDDRFAVPILTAFLHEAGHILAIYLCKAELSKIELTPLGARITAAIEELSSRQRAFVYFSGPLFNLLSAAFGLIADRTELFTCSAALAAANLLPIYPLDGGCLLHELFGARHELLLRMLSRLTLLAVWLFSMIILLLTGSISLWIFASYLFMTALLGSDNRPS